MHPPTPETNWRSIVAGAHRPDEAPAIARRLAQAVTALAAAERGAMIDSMLERLLGERRAYDVTLFLVAELDDPQLLGALAEHLDPLPGRLFEAEEAHLAELVRLVASAPETAALPVVDQYLVRRPIGPHWTTVVWALWPRRKSLFAAAWARFFETIDSQLWDDASVLEPFLATPDAVGGVRKQVSDSRRTLWPAVREAIERRAARATWLDETQRAALARALE